MNAIGPTELKEMFAAIAERLSKHRDDLNRLDANLGDGDHGTSIAAAFALADEKIAALEDAEAAEIWLAAAKALMNGMGGASGALFGTLFLKGVASARGKPELSKADLDAMWSAGLDGVMQRGRAGIGDKTMVDALRPTVDSFVARADFADAWSAAAEAARSGAESTVDMIARHGRAKFLGERGIGHQDAGATTIALMFEAIHDYWEAL